MEPNRKRMGMAVLLGAVLGIFCIIGVGARVDNAPWYLFGMWYNRILMGILIGFAGGWTLIEGDDNTLKNAACRGLILGILVTSAIMFSTTFRDIPSWFAGVAYGVIIDVGATYFSKNY